MEVKLNDFVKIDYDLYANDKLVQTTNEKLGKEANLNINSFEPFTLILGKNFILKALDDDILSGKSENVLELTSNNAYGKRDKKMIRLFPKSSFDENKTKIVVGMTYDFNGMYGTVKSIAGGRVMVDFNNPLAGKNIRLSYKIVGKVEKIDKKLSFILENIVKIPKTIFTLKVDGKNVEIFLPKELIAIKEQLIKSFEGILPEIKDYKLNFILNDIKLTKKEN